MDVCVLNRKGRAQKREEARGRPWKREEATEKGKQCLQHISLHISPSALFIDVVVGPPSLTHLTDSSVNGNLAGDRLPALVKTDFPQIVAIGVLGNRSRKLFLGSLN